MPMAPPELPDELARPQGRALSSSLSTVSPGELAAATARAYGGRRSRTSVLRRNLPCRSLRSTHLR
ncbi:hypothetical protein BKA01_003221 [Pseudonocardia eucalypti]|nr:hypothetical protein [Pseudonocardia eucalypti]